MAVIPVDHGQVNFKMAGVGYPTGAEVTFGIRRPAATDPATAAGIIATAWGAHLRVRTPEDVTLASILVKWGPNSTGPFAEVGVGSAGTGSSADVPPNVAMLIQKLTADGGRANRGRWFWPVGEDQVATGGTIVGADVTAMNSACAGFMGALTAADMDMVILHNSSLIDPTIVTSMATQAIAGTQRRRQRR